MKKINVTRSSVPPFEEYCNEIKGIWDSRWLTNNGEKHKKLGEDLKEYLNTPNITLFTNGHLALEAAIEAMDFPEGGEVITTPFTFASTTHAIVRCGLVPVFCDIKRDDYTIDTTKIEELITDKTCAIVPVHVYGTICDTEEIDKIAKKYGLKVIYDAAHAFGVTVNRESAANFGDASMFSFHATKVFNTIEGGCVCYKDDCYTKPLSLIKNFGIDSPESCIYEGGNAKMSEFQAAMGICNLRHLEEEIEKRKSVAERYIQRLGAVDGIKVIKEKTGVKSNYAYFPVLFDGYRLTRDQVFKRLAENSITARKYFYPLTSAFECYKDKFKSSPTPIAEEIASKILCLPMYADLEPLDVDLICDIILN